jgi:hypothetical protein
MKPDSFLQLVISTMHEVGAHFRVRPLPEPGEEWKPPTRYSGEAGPRCCDCGVRDGSPHNANCIFLTPPRRRT